MPHQCTRCGKIFPDAAEELLKGCSCGSNFFYYIKKERIEGLADEEKKIKEVMEQLEKADKEQIEKDIRELTGLEDEPEKPVILDIESVRVIKPGKFEIDIINLFSKRRPLIYKLEEGKYIIDLAASLIKSNKEDIKRKIRDPDIYLKKEPEPASEEESDYEEEPYEEKSKENNEKED
jgi:uncharacterized protein